MPVQQPSQAIYLASVPAGPVQYPRRPAQRCRPPCRYGILAVPAGLTPPSLPGLMTSQSPPTPATPVRCILYPTCSQNTVRGCVEFVLAALMDGLDPVLFRLSHNDHDGRQVDQKVVFDNSEFQYYTVQKSPNLNETTHSLKGLQMAHLFPL